MSLASISSVSVYPDFKGSSPNCSCNEDSSPTDAQQETNRRTATYNATHAHAEATDKGTASAELTPEEQKQVTDLKKQDREVKAHEAAHIAAGGAYVRGGATYSYQSGPDGKRYAVGGEVSIDTAPEDDPNATIRKMQAVRSAALAPANPSGQDRSVAAAACVS